MTDNAASQPEVKAIEPPATRAHLEWIDGMRAIAALYVLLRHITGFLYAPPIDVKWWWRLLTPFLFGRAAVATFIVISGFCLMIPVARRGGEMRGGILGFARRRAKRILPPYYAAIAFAIIVTLGAGLTERTHEAWELTLPLDVWSVVVDALLMQDFTGNLYAVNYCFWSIAVEWHLYFVFPIVVLLHRRMAAGVMATGVCLAVLLTSVSGAAAKMHLPHYWHYIALFTCGAAGAVLAFDEKHTTQRARLQRFGPSVAAGAAGLVWVCYKFRLGAGTAPDLMLGIACSALMVTLALRQDLWLTKLLGSRPLVWLGGFSYSLYLTHAIVLQWVWVKLVLPMQLSGTGRMAWQALICIPLTLAVGYGFFLLFERPFMQTAKPTLTAAPE